MKNHEDGFLNTVFFRFLCKTHMIKNSTSLDGAGREEIS